ncbi:flagellar basal body P-ring formation chaperone FlgA [Mesoterricola sediminis]|uniref:Flagella basal body P-ring formation protein FlgA n=1 Tax=Mesoterricola sediminis TaxID=2927980 RepID=A0AA48GXE2_9BACT|nr:flagellar basal body P-ring formation chaperone FlgA [Mesoterricola sediminis]BDU77395.1 hypothetical protein METESE_23530 [Mesoterricola sediminis]
MKAAVLLLCCALLRGGEAVVLPPGDRLQAQALAYVQEQAAGRDGSYTFKVVHMPVLPRPAKGDLAFEPAHLSRNDLTGRFYVSFNALADGRNLGMVRVDLEGRWAGKLLKFRAAQPRKTPLEAALLEPVDFEGVPPAGALREVPPGHRLRGPVTEGHLLVRTDVEAIPLVNAGDPVRLELVDGDLTISVDAVAKSSGAAGDRIRLEMPTNRKLVQAVVTGPGAARVRVGGSK